MGTHVGISGRHFSFVLEIVSPFGFIGELLGEIFEVGIMLLTIGSSIKTLLICWFLTHLGGDDFLIFVKESLWFSTFVDKFSTLGLGMISSGFVFEVTV